MSNKGMSNNGWKVPAAGMATAAAAHAMFFCALIAGQPAPAQYLAQLAAPPHQTMESPQWRVAAQGEYPADGQAAHSITVAQPAAPEHLHKGLTTC